MFLVESQGRGWTFSWWTHFTCPDVWEHSNLAGNSPAHLGKEWDSPSIFFFNRSLSDLGVLLGLLFISISRKKFIWCLKFNFVLGLSLLYITYKKILRSHCKELHAKQNWEVFEFNIGARADHRGNKNHSPVVQDILIWLCSLGNLFSLILVWLSAGFPWSRRLKLIQGPKLFSSVLTKPRIQCPCVNTLWLSWIFKPHSALWPKMEGGLQWETYGREWNFRLEEKKGGGGQRLRGKEQSKVENEKRN